METQVLDLVEGLHRWCVADQGPALPTLLTRAQAWLAQQLQPVPATEADWLALWRMPLHVWWPTTLPAGWERDWRLLSRQEATLTAEALSYLETHRSGVMATVLPSTPGSAPVLPTALKTREASSKVPSRWSLDDLVTCVIREVRRREHTYPQLIQQQRLTPEQAELELSQMRAVQAYLLARLQEGAPPQQQVLF